MKREYYFCCCRLDKKYDYFIWFSDEKDGVCLNSEGNLLSFYDLKSLSNKAKKRNILIEDKEPVFYDFDKIKKFCIRKNLK